MSAPILLPITLATAGACGLLQAVLAALVIRQRVAASVLFGDGSNEALLRHIRAHGNLSEYLPAVLLLVALLELGGAKPIGLGAAAFAFVLGRCGHAYGLLSQRAMWARQAGMIATLFVLSTLACWGVLKAVALWL